MYKTEIDSQALRTHIGLQRGKGGGGDKLGVWDQQIHTTVYKIDKEQGPTVEHRQLYSVSCNGL